MDGKQLLMKHFQVKAERVPFDSEAMCYESNGILYLIIDVTKKEQKYLYELHQMSRHMIGQGEKGVATFLPDQSGHFLLTEEKKEFVVLASRRMSPLTTFTGGELAKFHLRGQSLPLRVQHASEFGSWKDKWEQRLENMEKAVGKLVKERNDSFARLIIESFPYYMGLAENAIQYVADTEMDESPGEWDVGVICQMPFRETAWTQEPAIHHPFNWIFDHAARDVAEWIRLRYWQGSLLYRSNLAVFIRQYEQMRPLSPFAWRLIYGRLLFPAHYFDCAESYFSAASFHLKKENEEKLKKYMTYSHEHEKFLAFFYEQAGVPVRQFNLPKIPWLGSTIS
ncbi:spore coat protein YutH [Bacillus sp. B190/17]|uniref:Spore coat protein YutH n=1 Tax=Bacillus lumedeiriae TaxID=3058829 RepID=A0ABW8ICT9_9BACI